MIATNIAVRLLGILFVSAGFLFLLRLLSNEWKLDEWSAFGIFMILVGAILFCIGGRLKGRSGRNRSSRDKPEDDLPGRPWYRTDPYYDDMMAHK